VATIFLDTNQQNFNVANDGDKVFGQQGTESVTILSGVTGVVLDANVDEITFDGNVSDFSFQQQGNRLLVYSGNDLVATGNVQTDTDGTVLTFDDGTYSAEFGEGSVIEIGGTPVPDDEPGAVVPEDDPSGTVTEVSIDTGTPESPVAFNASGGAFEYSDDASVTTHVEISGFGSDDTIAFTNGDVDNYAFASEGTDVRISYNYQDEGTMNVITLTGVIENNAIVNDLATFTDAIGFDPFVV
jgi:hypothetical protein